MKLRSSYSSFPGLCACLITISHCLLVNFSGEAPCNYGVPIACVNGELNVRVRIKQNDRVTGSKLDIQVMLDAVHMLIYPQQLHSLMELINGITNEGDMSKIN